MNEPYQRVSEENKALHIQGTNKGYYTSGTDSPMYGAIYDDIQKREEAKRRALAAGAGTGVGALAGSFIGRNADRKVFRGGAKSIGIGAGAGLLGGMFMPLPAKTYEAEAQAQYRKALQEL